MATVLVLGASGMLGHTVARSFAERFRVLASCRTRPRSLPALSRSLSKVQWIDKVEATSIASIQNALQASRPDAVINCIGIVKQATAAADTWRVMQVNALFPHQLADLCEASGARLIHISTDCVFSGRSGSYRETDMPDADDLYGRSKQLGEVIRPGCLTIRTSIIGRELSGSHGLLEWFLGHRGGEVDGFTQAVFSGLTTLELARVLERVVSDHGDLAGLFHVASEPISKADLLSRINAAMGLGVRIRPVDQPVIDRSLDGSQFAEITGIRVPSWDKMIADLANETLPYDDWRRRDGST